MKVSERDRYEDVVLRSRPVFYVPAQGQGFIERVRNVSVSTSNVSGYRTGPFPGCYARDFNGTNSTITVNSHASYHPGDTFSVGGWVRRDGSSTAGHALLHNGTGDFVLWIESSGGSLTNSLALRKAGTGDVFFSSATYTDTDWMHVIAVKNAGTSAAIYVNGVSIAGTYSNQTIVASSTDPTIGDVAGGSGNWLDGSATHMAIWNRVLTLPEITTLYRAGKDAT